MKLILLIIFSLVLSLLACKSPINQHNNDSTQKLLTEIKGNWILASYVDSIYEHKSILSQSLTNNLIWTSIFLEIQDSTLLLSGSLHKNISSEKINPHADSIFYLDRDDFYPFGKKYLLSYDSAKKNLIFTGIDNQDYIFRRFDEVEQQLLTKKDGVYDASYTILLQKKIIAGEYTIEGEPESIVIFHPDGNLEGFYDFDHYSIDNCFSTAHWLPNDLIYFLEEEEEESKVWIWEYTNPEKTRLKLQNTVGLKSQMKAGDEIIYLVRKN
ncbi:MAG: hypothetical protein GY810_11250 [Aureispira sp.]|nr:hypothetical protein [Aureispira sp.]